MLDLVVLRAGVGPTQCGPPMDLDQYPKDQATSRHFSKLINQGLGEVKLEQLGFGLRNTLRDPSRSGAKTRGGRAINSN